MSTADILDVFARQNIVITGIAEQSSFDADTLETLTTMDTVVSIQGTFYVFYASFFIALTFIIRSVCGPR